MDAGFVMPQAGPPSWKLRPDVAACTQALVVTGFGDLPHGRALFLEFRWPQESSGTGWLDTLSKLAPVTSAAPSNTKAQTRAAALAFSITGLHRMRLVDTALASFSRPFREGMFQEDRLRRLGDRRAGVWLEGVVPGGPAWSANAALPDPVPTMTGGFDVPHDGSPEQQVVTEVTVHALLLLYARTGTDALSWAAKVEAALAAHQVAVVRQLDLVLNPIEGETYIREHFGFADALSQPLPYDAREGDAGRGSDCQVLSDGKPAEKDPVQGVPLGDFLIGYPDSHHDPSPGPVVPATPPPPPDAGLLASSRAEGFFDLGLNGSYLVVRELKQDVPAFWHSMTDNARNITAQDPASAGLVTADWLAERVIGRDAKGHLLCPMGKLAALPGNIPDSGFLFRATDPRGVGCPPGSHVRRAFPRDALAPTAADGDVLLQAANNHRILRRGRKFGPPIADRMVDDGAHRGLLFMCLNTDIDRQFEFIQQTWMLNTAFATLSDEVDPLVGPAGPMTIRDRPVRRTVQVDTFVHMAGGDYFFLPSLPALRYLAML